MVDVAIVGYGQVPSVRCTEITETQMVLDVTQQALRMAGVDRHDIGFTVSGSCDYLAGQAFAFVQTIEAIGAWPPISESHVEMDGAWAMYEGWTRLQEGDVDLVLVYSHGRSSPGTPWQVWPLQLDPYHLAPLGLDPWSLAAHGLWVGTVLACRMCSADEGEFGSESCYNCHRSCAAHAHRYGKVWQ